MSNTYSTIRLWFIAIMVAIIMFFASQCVLYGEEWQFEVVHTQQVSRQSEFYIVMFGAEWCGPCRVFERSELPKLRELMPLSNKIDIDKHPKWKLPKNLKFKSGNKDHAGIRSLPTFWLIERSSDKSEVIVQEWIGNPGVQIMLDKVRKLNYSASSVDPDVILNETSNPQDHKGR